MSTAEVSTTAELDQISDGLDALENQAITQNRRHIDWVAILAPLAVVAALIGIWQLVYLSGIKDPWVLPSPASVWSTLWQSIRSGEAWSAIWVSLHRGLIGFAVSVVIGTVLGLLIGQFAVLRKGFRPLLSAMQSLPSVAWVPFAIVVFQLSPATIYLVVLLGAVPSIANGLIGGLDQTPPLLRRAGTVLGANRLEMIRYVLLPAALPTYVSGLKQGWAFAWRSLMAAELVANAPSLGSGLGQMLENGSTQSDMPTVIAAIALILVVGIVIDLLIFAPLERRVLRARGLTPAGL